MKFADVRSACDRFGQLLHKTTSRSYIDAVSVEEPAGAEDELHFFKLVLWCYVFWFEASHPAGKHVASLLRTGRPIDYKRVTDTFRSVQYLRTVRAHNLQVTSKTNEYQKTQAELWLITSGGNPTDWQKCCRRMCEDVAEAVKLLTHIWTVVMNDVEDVKIGIEQLQLAVNREWPAYRFDQLLEEAASNVGLKGLDVVAYRTSRIGEWQRLSRFFNDTQDAESAFRRAIFRELEDLFGTADRGQAGKSEPEDS